MNEWIKDVADFHRVMELPTRERPTVPPADEVRMRLRINVEEMFEQLSACGEQPEEGDYGGSWQQHLESSKNEVMRLIDQMPVSARKAFITEGKHTVAHGGVCIEEVIVPFVQFSRSP